MNLPVLQMDLPEQKCRSSLAFLGIHALVLLFPVSIVIVGANLQKPKIGQEKPYNSEQVGGNTFDSFLSNINRN